MPYIPLDQRAGLDLFSTGKQVQSPGQLNFAITRLIMGYLVARFGKASYTGLNEVAGVLACAGAELYRRVTALYEDGKRDENGDVYEEILP